VGCFGFVVALGGGGGGFVDQLQYIRTRVRE